MVHHKITSAGYIIINMLLNMLLNSQENKGNPLRKKINSKLKPA